MASTKVKMDDKCTRKHTGVEDYTWKEEANGTTEAMCL